MRRGPLIREWPRACERHARVWGGATLGCGAEPRSLAVAMLIDSEGLSASVP